MNSFQVDLPRDDLIYSPAVSAFPSAAIISEPPKTLLVVDDDPMVRDLETQMLRQQGYTVLPAEGTAEALRLAREAAAIHLLITDFSMPEDGVELTRRFRAVHPKTPVLMVSASMPVVLRGGTPAFNRFDLLAKPFAFKELLHKVRTLLEAAAPLPIRAPLRKQY